MLTFGAAEVEVGFDKRSLVDKAHQQGLFPVTLTNISNCFFEKNPLYYYNPDYHTIKRAVFDKDNEKVKQLYRWSTDGKYWVVITANLATGRENELPRYNYHISEKR